MSEQMSYLNHLIWKAAHAAHALNESIRTALDMQNEAYAIKHLENALTLSGQLTQIGPTTDRVAPRPDVEALL